MINSLTFRKKFGSIFHFLLSLFALKREVVFQIITRFSRRQRLLLLSDSGKSSTVNVCNYCHVIRYGITVQAIAPTPHDDIGERRIRYVNVTLE